MLEHAGWILGADGVRVKHGTRLSLAFISSVGTPDADIFIELIRSWWEQIGAEISVRRFAPSLLFAPYGQQGILANGRFDAMLFGRYLPSPFDITLAYGCNQTPPLGQNVSHYCNPQFDALAEQYDTTYDERTRVRLLASALHLIDEDSLVIVISGREDLFALNDAVRGFRPNNATPFDDMMRVDVTGT